MYALGWVHPEHYVVQVLTLLLGCFILGLGISFEVKADVAMVTGEYLVQVMSRFEGVLRRYVGDHGLHLVPVVFARSGGRS